MNLGDVISSTDSSFVKLDLEGHEHMALEALFDFNERPILITEDNPGAAETGRLLGYEIHATNDLFPDFAHLTNLSLDLLLTSPGYVTAAFKNQINAEVRTLLRCPKISWRE